ncbi:MAG: hypothetical protein QOF76_2723 [Solirubrobacteraceae bacterium]|nr:hypothetical protein [Solirubrobacteraceae bacterium]
MDVAVGGAPAFWADAARTSKQDLANVEKLTLPLALLVLFVVFGSVTAGLMPLVTGAAGVAAGLLLVRLVSHITDIQLFTVNLAVLVGLGAGIDYALLAVTRTRDELRAGSDLATAIRGAGERAGHAICVSVGAVLLALAGLLTLGISVVTGLGLATMGVVACVAAAAGTLLPAILALSGDRLARPHAAWLERLPHPQVVAPVLARVERRPLVAAGAAVILLGVLALPLAGLKLSHPGVDVLPPGTGSREAARLAGQALGPGAGTPILVAVDRGVRVSSLTRRAAQLPRVVAVSRLRGPRHTLVEIRLAASPDGPLTAQTLSRLRSMVPRTALLGGAGAESKVELDQFRRRLPIALGLIVVLTMLIFFAAFHSAIISIKAGLVNLLSVAATLGASTWAFQGGHLAFLGLQSTPNGVIDYVPLFVFSMVYGLSMDYEVFLLTRIQEERARGIDARLAVIKGTKATSGVITGAAAVLISVALPFTFTDLVFTQVLGFALLFGILLDATIVRLILVPSVLLMLGERAWSRPGRRVAVPV